MRRLRRHRHALVGLAGAAAVLAVSVLAVSILAPLQPRWQLPVGVLVAALVLGVSRHRIQERAEAEIAQREARFRGLVQQSSDVIILIVNGRIDYQSPSSTRVLGYPADSLLGAAYDHLIHPDDRDHIVAFVTGRLEADDAVGLVAFRIRHADGHFVHVEANCHNQLADPAVGGFVINLRDVTERKRLEEALEHRAFHDSLTGLANRALFRDRVEHVTAAGARHDRPCAVLFIDLDGFKEINDSLGHAVGDAVLVEVAARIRDGVRDEDTAARLGGDEFAVLIDDPRHENHPRMVAQRLCHDISRPVLVDGESITVDASVGIATSTPDITADELVRNADIAMYLAKRAGKGCQRTFEPGMHQAVVERARTAADLVHAFDAGEFLLHYQPIVHLDTGEVVGTEALVRWNHPSRGLVRPADFVAIAEQTGDVVRLGRWVLHEACRQTAAWQRELSLPALTINVNVSATQLTASGDLVTHVRDALEQSGLAPSNLTLELTESALFHDSAATTLVLYELKALGVRLAVDDFGTGYSSLAYLQRFPLDVLKIDRSFVGDDGDEDSPTPALLRAIIEMGRSLQLQTIAEGIEHSDELARFQALHCQYGQGFLFAAPGSGRSMQAMLAAAR